MAHRTAHQASLATKKATDSRWRYCLRNPVFRKELTIVSRLATQLDRCSAQARPARAQPFQQRFDAFLKKWGFSYLQMELLLIYYDLRRRPVPDMIADLDGAKSYVHSFPVEADGPKDDFYLHLHVDLRHPFDVLIAHIKEELHEAIGDQARRRRRLDKVDFHLDVYDRAFQGHSFASIAHTVGKRISTVKSAYAAALRNIYGSTPAPKKGDLARSVFDWKTFNFESHYVTCRACKEARKPEEMCPPFRAYVAQDYRGQKELPGYNTVADSPVAR